MENNRNLDQHTRRSYRVKIQFLWKADGSGVGNCPSLSRVVGAPGGYVAVGKKIDAATRAQISEVGDDEIAVWLPADVIDRIRDLRP